MFRCMSGQYLKLTIHSGLILTFTVAFSFTQLSQTSIPISHFQITSSQLVFFS